MTKTSKRVAIVQSCYIPWKGYFDMIAAVDEFILYDDMQYTRRDWRNRNQIKTPQGLIWLTVPVRVKGKYHQAIRDTGIEGMEWAASHWKSLCLNYKRAPHFDSIAKLLEPFYTARQYTHLSELNQILLQAICDNLGVKTKLTRSWDYALAPGKTERLVDLCRQAEATEYISGPLAKDYLDAGQFPNAGIKLTWFDYEGYPAYPQLWGEFRHEVSIVDLLFNCGHEAKNYMKYVNPG